MTRFAPTPGTSADPDDPRCRYCGKPIARKVFSSGLVEGESRHRRRTFCDKRCMGLEFQRMPMRAPVVNSGNGHFWARKKVPLGPCRRCGKQEGWTDVHHIDGDYGNNNLANLIRLCRGCHLRVHRYGQPLVLESMNA